MNCLNCRSHVLNTWLYCPQCGKPTSLAAGYPKGDSSFAAQNGSQILPAKLHYSLNVGLLLVTPQGRIGHINAAARALFQIPVNQDTLGKPCAEFIPHAACMTIINRHMAAGFQSAMAEEDEDADKSTEISIKNGEDQELFYQVYCNPLQDGADTSVGTVFLFNNITDLRNVERMKTEFVSIVSKELCTPFTPIKGFVQTLLQDENEEWYDLATRREFYTIIDENIDRLSRLIHDLLNPVPFGPCGSEVEMNWEPNVGLRKLAEDVLEIYQGRTDKHTIILDFEPEEIVFKSDPDRLQMILHNFVSNAIKYSPEGGEVRIIARIKPAEEEFPLVSVLIGVRDQGIGMSREFQQRIGEKPLLTDDENRQKIGGTGIGLYLVKHLVSLHHGVMKVESELGKGSTFWVRLPREALPKRRRQKASLETLPCVEALACE
ncbi:MAG: sensor signal transduction histidine kinase [Chthonomonadales bacterium]|nr:sensor signal transduction histidine kinase [Chthonomonadales bacterium]